jgi:hypothetical protein
MPWHITDCGTGLHHGYDAKAAQHRARTHRLRLRVAEVDRSRIMSLELLGSGFWGCRCNDEDFCLLSGRYASK